MSDVLDQATDDLYRQAVHVVASSQKASTSYVQRQLRIGYNAAARLIDRMEKEGKIGAPDHVGRREVLIASDDVEESYPAIPDEAPARIGHNSEGNVAADQLRQYIERIERLAEEVKGMQDDIKDVFLEAKATGYDPKTMKAIVRLRKMEKNDRDEAEALLETYKAALGLS